MKQYVKHFVRDDFVTAYQLAETIFGEEEDVPFAFYLRKSELAVDPYNPDSWIAHRGSDSGRSGLLLSRERDIVRIVTQGSLDSASQNSRNTMSNVDFVLQLYQSIFPGEKFGECSDHFVMSADQYSDLVVSLAGGYGICPIMYGHNASRYFRRGDVGSNDLTLHQTMWLHSKIVLYSMLADNDLWYTDVKYFHGRNDPLWSMVRHDGLLGGMLAMQDTGFSQTVVFPDLGRVSLDQSEFALPLQQLEMHMGKGRFLLIESDPYVQAAKRYAVTLFVPENANAELYFVDLCEKVVDGSLNHVGYRWSTDLANVSRYESVVERACHVGDLAQHLGYCGLLTVEVNVNPAGRPTIHNALPYINDAFLLYTARRRMRSDNILTFEMTNARQREGDLSRLSALETYQVIPVDWHDAAGERMKVILVNDMDGELGKELV